MENRVILLGIPQIFPFLIIGIHLLHVMTDSKHKRKFIATYTLYSI